MNLTFTARSIIEAENERGGESFVKIASDFSMRNITLLVRKGMRLEKRDENQALDAIDAYLAGGENRSVFSLYGEIIDKLEEDRFLAKELKIGENFRKAMKNPEALQTNGQKESEQPSQLD